MSTATEKELAAASLRVYASRVEAALDGIPGVSAEAWDCPAADAFVAGVAAEQANLDATADTMRAVADSLDAAAAAQRAAEAAAQAAAEAEAAAAAAAAAPPPPEAPPPAPAAPMNVL